MHPMRSLNTDRKKELYEETEDSKITVKKSKRQVDESTVQSRYDQFMNFLDNIDEKIPKPS